MEDPNQTIVADAGQADKGDNGAAAKAAPAPAAEPAAKPDKAVAPTADKADPKTIATGGDTEAEDAAKDAAKPAAKTPWPENWRDLIAKHASAGDEKIYKKEMKRLERITDPAGIYGSFRELEGKFTGGGLLKVPSKDAKPEEVAAFNKALGVPEKPEDYFKEVKLENGAVIGDADKPLVSSVAAEMHKAGATPAVMSAMLNWYYKNQEDQAAALDEADDSFRREAEGALKEEFGPAFKRKVNAIATLFAAAPGGADVKNENGLYARLMGGRMADGRVIGNDPEMVRFLVSLVSEVNPAATVVEEGNQSGMSIDAELANIRKVMREDRPAYNKDTKMQSRYLELLGAASKMKARG